MLSGLALRTLVRQGVNLELDARQVDAALACDLLQLGGASHFTFIAAGHYDASTLERIAALGHSRITFRFDTDFGGSSAA
ncbi:hypothetical protein [Phenylobacterium sp.]|uniref:hypothetical protein n=1 Tax=Phenylobacterium sp. TaxID=1871053 RepID=UPI001219D7ED|nr:hypothetical protein [Phenylobacterium sp.]THD58848.1 MAG: hypothetical protein E8A49_17805 [Phenylobacterium sp.]